MKLNLNKFNCEQKVLLGCLLISLLFQNIGQATAFENEFQNQEEVRDKHKCVKLGFIQSALAVRAE